MCTFVVVTISAPWASVIQNSSILGRTHSWWLVRNTRTWSSFVERRTCWRPNVFSRNPWLRFPRSCWSRCRGRRKPAVSSSSPPTPRILIEIRTLCVILRGHARHVVSDGRGDGRPVCSSQSIQRHLICSVYILGVELVAGFFGVSLKHVVNKDRDGLHLNLLRHLWVEEKLIFQPRQKDDDVGVVRRKEDLPPKLPMVSSLVQSSTEELFRANPRSPASPVFFLLSKGSESSTLALAERSSTNFSLFDLLCIFLIAFRGNLL